MKYIKKYPMVILLVLSTLLLSEIGAEGRDTVYQPYKKNLWKTPYLAMALQGMKDGISFLAPFGIDGFMEDEAVVAAQNPQAAEPPENMGEGVVETEKNASREEGALLEDSETGTENTLGNSQEKEEIKKPDENRPESEAKPPEEGLESNMPVRPAPLGDGSMTKYVETEPIPIDSPWYRDHGRKALTTEYPYETVTVDYFDDAVFIGDSRTHGLLEYAGWDNTTFYAETGLTIYNIFEKEICEIPGEKGKFTIEEALEKVKFGKIYIMVGINELGKGGTKAFFEQYTKVIARIRELQPYAIIYIQGIMNVSEKQNEDPIFNNININDKNAAIAVLANGIDIFYLDCNPDIMDENGFMPSEYTTDGIHVKAQYLPIWEDFLLRHAVVLKDEVKAE